MIINKTFKDFKRIYKASCDIGFIRLQKRIRFQIRSLLDRFIPLNLRLFCAGIKGEYPEFIKENNFSKIFSQKSNYYRDKSPDYVNIKLLNRDIILKWPIKWENNTWPRLLIFNLHYFDWIIIWLNKRNSEGAFQTEVYFISSLIDSWIDSNYPGKFNAWHSYTISLRIRNWIWFFKYFPCQATKKRIDSIWEQLCWLKSHPEDGLGGNHWLENLISIAIVSRHFNSEKARKMHSDALLKLEKELSLQILRDGGHEERSASYHLILLNHLTELGIIIEEFDNYRPKWLLSTIKKMHKWIEDIKLINGDFPRFNDSPKDPMLNIVKVSDFSAAYINQSVINKNTLEGFLTRIYKKNNSKILRRNFINELIDLKDTGWTIIRLSPGWELIFKCGIPCPKHLPGHAHSDLLSFELLYNGFPILSEAGTSLYENSYQRIYERSGSAHNTLQIAISKDKHNEKINWIEPLDIFGTFYAGDKPNSINKRFGKVTNNKFWVSGSHNGYEKYGIIHSRLIEIESNYDNLLFFKIKDKINSKKEFYWRYWNHLAPKINQNIFDKLIEETLINYRCNMMWSKTSFSEFFGDYQERNSLSFSGKSTKNETILEFKYKIDKNNLFGF